MSTVLDVGDNGVSDEDQAGLCGPIKTYVDGVVSFPGAQWWDQLKHPDLPTALHSVLELFDRTAGARTGHLTQADDPHRSVRLFRVRAKEVLVLPDEHDAASARSVIALLPCRGYRATATANNHTPLTALRPPLSLRVFNQLAREGFTTVEQVTAVPDTALMDIRGMGGPSITAIRDAIAAVTTTTVPTGDVRLDAEQVRDLTGLLTTLNAYAQGHGSHDIARRADAFLLSLADSTPADPAREARQ